MTEADDSSEVQLQKPHPFFSAPNAFPKNGNILNPPTPDPSCSPPSDNSNDPANLPENPGCHCESLEPKPKRQKTGASGGTSKTRSKTPRTKHRACHSTEPNIISHFGQKITKDQQIEGSQTPVDKSSSRQADSGIQSSSATTPKPAVAVDHELAKVETNQDNAPNCEQKPQKLLKFNPATGTIGSPPRSKTSTLPLALVAGKTGSKRGRKRKALVITISYGTDPASRKQIGNKVQEIIGGTSRFTPAVPANTEPKTPPSSQDSVNEEKPATSTPKKRTPRKTVTPKKPSHPFFQAKGKPVSSSSNNGQREKKQPKMSPGRQVIFTSTPCSPRRPRASNFSVPAFGSKYSGGMKIPGAQYPAWPWRDIVHIHDNPSPRANGVTGSEQVLVASRRRKAKGQAVQLGNSESILCEAVSRLGIRELAHDIRQMDNEYLRPVASTIRVPTKHFESGYKLQSQIFKELRTLKYAGASSKTHPAIKHLYNSIPITLSAFDRSTCESTAWAQKYAPTSAHCVLQSGREAELLRDWLQTLKVQAVDTGSSDTIPKAKGAPALKRRRRNKKLEGFVVSSDEEANEMDEISENELEWLAHGGPSGSKKTVVRSGDTADRGKPGGRLTNAVLLSGPHGCGKTATVYAIAKELGFEVFEINAGARRSGKDILERVGDMTRNHQVKHNHKGDNVGDAATDDSVAKDLKSGKQGMMTSFFQPKQVQLKNEAHTTPKAPEVETAETQAPVPASQGKRVSRDQKQSLILLEEVDILYEEDKQFWSTVITMIAQSKRPFVMTCNDELVIPFQSLKLHGIFRLSPPPTDLAVDLLLLIAANEGHALGRHAVETLYESRAHDLRAAITELNYWCQIGVGDLRGGFNWFYPRWPKGSDVDGEGHIVRVVSQDTYLAGMGWFNRDLASTTSTLPSTVPELHQQAWEHWGLDISDHHELGDPSDWAKRATEQASSPAARLALLESVELFADSISESDICGPFLPSLSNHVPLDATSPNLHVKALDDFTIGNKLLEVIPLHHYDSTSMEVSTSLRILAQSKLLSAQPLARGEDFRKRFDEKCVTNDIERHIKASAQSEGPITRVDYSIAFDPIAMSEKALANGYLGPSVFDNTMVSICLDIAPFVRSIVAYDQRLQGERRMRSNLISEGGKPEKKRMRTTRAALSALEGGSRATTRREKYFAADINPYLVIRTGGKQWEEIALQQQQLVDSSKDHNSEAQDDHYDTDVDLNLNQSSGGQC